MLLGQNPSLRSATAAEGQPSFSWEFFGVVVGGLGCCLVQTVDGLLTWNPTHTEKSCLAGAFKDPPLCQGCLAHLTAMPNFPYFSSPNIFAPPKIRPGTSMIYLNLVSPLPETQPWTSVLWFQRRETSLQLFSCGITERGMSPPVLRDATWLIK